MKKKITAFLIASASLLLLAGCNKETSGDFTAVNMDKYMTLGEYKGLTVEYNLAEASEDAVAEQIKTMMIANSEKIGLKEGKAKNGDLVNINYVGYKDDVPFEGGTANSQNVRIGAKKYISGFEEGIIGMTPGETKDLDLTFPEDYQKSDLAGQKVVFSITLNYIYPEITDEVVAKMENVNYSSKEEFMDYAKKVVEQEAEDGNTSGVTSVAFEKILENSTFKEVPQSLKDLQRADLEKRYAAAIEGGGGGLDTVIQYIYGASADELIEVYTKQRMATQAIAKAEGIVVTEEEVDARLNEVGAMYGMDAENYLKVNEISREKFKELMISEKVQQFVYENTNVVPVGSSSTAE